MDLFAASAKKRHVGQPLAERMRPRSLEELVGQRHLVGPGRILSGLAPGAAHPLLAPLGTAGERKDHARAAARRNSESGAERPLSGRCRGQGCPRGSGQGRGATRSVRRADLAVHRRDPSVLEEPAGRAAAHVEAGTVTLIGATTENPSFGVVAALLSRCRVVRLEALSGPRARPARPARGRRPRARPRRPAPDDRRRGHRSAGRHGRRRRPPAVLGARGRRRALPALRPALPRAG